MTNPQVMTRPRSQPNHRGISSPRNALGQRLYGRWISELWAGRRIAAELVSSDFVGHWPTRDVRGPDELQTHIDNTRGTLQELQFVIEVGPIAEGDMMAARWIGTGASKDGPARFTGNDLMRIANGKIVEYWAGTARS